MCINHVNKVYCKVILIHLCVVAAWTWTPFFADTNLELSVKTPHEEDTTEEFEAFFHIVLFETVFFGE